MKLLVESSRSVPLVWYEISVLGGSAGDPVGGEGLVRCAAELARRGAGGRTRAELDRALDQLGSSLEVSATRDRFALQGVCLARNVDATIALVGDVLAAPAMADAELVRLLVDTRALLDEVRDDDSELAQRFFLREWAGAHPYSRTAIGTAESLDAMSIDAVRAAYRRLVVPDNLVVGFAGDVDEQRAAALAASLTARLPADPAPELPELPEPAPAPGRRTVLVDKDERTQIEVLIGHPAPRWGTADYDALVPVETVFGGTFTSRLMQEIRVKRGWSYGAGCRLSRARGPLWFRIAFASAAETAPDAIARALEMYEELAAGGLTDDELAFAHSYLAGNWPFSIATPRARLRVRSNAAVCALPDDFAMSAPQRIAAVTMEDTRRAIAAWLHPGDVLVVAVASAGEMLPRFENLPIGPIEVVPHDSY